MIGIKHEDKNKILDYCIRKCVENHDALLGIRTFIIREKVVFYLKYAILNKYDEEKSPIDKTTWSNVIIRTAQLDYRLDELSKNMGYTQRNKLITIS